MHIVGGIRDGSYNSLMTDKRIWPLLKLHDAIKNKPRIKTNQCRTSTSHVNINCVNSSGFVPSLPHSPFPEMSHQCQDDRVKYVCAKILILIIIYILQKA